jgi:mannitol-1-/sugar-/sorbitol-6-phosphatase
MPASAIQAFIFDLDGTIVDTELLWADAMFAYLQDRGCGCDRRGILEIVYGRSWLDIHRDITAAFPSVAGESAAEMARELSIYHKRLCENADDVVIESSVKLLRELAAHYPVIVVSGSPRDDVIHNLKLAGVLDCVRFVLGAEDYPEGKPSPSGFLKGAALLGVPPAACLVFEDSRAGVTAAKAAGMMCVALARENAHAQDVSHADLVVADLAEFDIRRLPPKT